MFQICPGNFDSYPVSEAILAPGAAAHKAVMPFVEFIEIGEHLAQRHHPLDVRFFKFYVHSPFGDTRNGTVELHAHLVLHVLYQLVFHAGTLGVGGHELTLGGMHAFPFELTLVF